MMPDQTLRLYARQLRFEPLESRRLLSVTVDTLVDENNGIGVGAGTSLREAIAVAASGDTIDFSVTGTINLSVGTTNSTKHLAINKSLTIAGPGANLLTIKAFDPTPATKNGDGSRIFNIDDGNTATLANVQISGLTLTGGDTVTAGGAINSSENLVVADSLLSGNTTTVNSLYYGGGAIHSKATLAKPNSLTVLGTTFSGNTAPNSEGGAIRQRWGNVTIENSTVSSNSARNAGSGLSAADGNVNVTIRKSTFDGNKSTVTTGTGQGGAIFGVGARITISDTTITNNDATYLGGGVFARGFSTVTITGSLLNANAAYRGGGIYTVDTVLTVLDSTVNENTGGGIDANGGGLTVRNSTISSNTGRSGAGVRAGANALIENSTISGNTATEDASAIYNYSGNLTIRFCTITKNVAPTNRFGAIVSWGKTTGTITVLSSIIAGNTNGDLGYKNNPSPFVSLGYNLIGGGVRGTASFNSTGDQVGVLNPMLGPLADNGGVTKTHIPLAGSPAIDVGDPAAEVGMGNTPLFDQRAFPYLRVADGDTTGGSRIDIGATELQTPSTSASAYGDYNTDGRVDALDYVVWRKVQGSTVLPFTGADATGNGRVGTEDYNVWRARFGTSIPAPAFATAALLASEYQSQPIFVVNPSDATAQPNNAGGSHLAAFTPDVAATSSAFLFANMVQPISRRAHSPRPLASDGIHANSDAETVYDIALTLWLETRDMTIREDVAESRKTCCSREHDFAQAAPSRIEVARGSVSDFPSFLGDDCERA